MDFWKTVWAPLIVLIIGSVAVGVLLGRIQSPATPSVSAEVQWIGVPSPLFSSAFRSNESRKKLVDAISGGLDEAVLFGLLADTPTMRIGVVSVSNSSNIRSKEIELSSDAVIFLSSEATKERKLSRTSITLKPLNPGATVDVAAIYPHITYRNPSVLGLHDHTKIQIYPRDLNEELAWIVKFVLSSFILSALLVVVLFLGLVALPLVPVAIIAEYSLAFKARVTNKSEIEKMVKFLNYLKQHHQDKLPPVLT